MATSTSTPKGRGHLIDLTPDEAGVLSFVAAYAKIPAAKPQLNIVLSTSTKRAQAIGAVILDQSKTTSPGNTFMAGRFSRASESNIKNSDILNKASRLK
jgi:hypothetical protein